MRLANERGQQARGSVSKIGLRRPYPTVMVRKGRVFTKTRRVRNLKRPFRATVAPSGGKHEHRLDAHELHRWHVRIALTRSDFEITLSYRAAHTFKKRLIARQTRWNRKKTNNRYYFIVYSSFRLVEAIVLLFYISFKLIQDNKYRESICIYRCPTYSELRCSGSFSCNNHYNW